MYGAALPPGRAAFVRLGTGMARPTKYTEELAEAICKDIERGNTFRVAALANGIQESTFHLWREKYSEFSERVLVAEAKAEREVVRMMELKIHEGATDLIKFYLTHRNNDGWKPPKETKVHEGNPDAPLVVERMVFRSKE